MFIREMYKTIAFETITANTTATGFTASKIAPSGGNTVIGALVTAETAAMRVRYDGTAPNTTTGHLLNSGDVVEVWGSTDLDNFKVVRQGATNGTLQVSYYAA